MSDLSFLVGTWRGEGKGSYPTIEAFEYTEEVVFAEVPGKPFLSYQQCTKGTDGNALHTECGYLRSPSPGVVELMVAQPTGLTEVHSGILTEQRIDLMSVDVGSTPTAIPVYSVARRLRVEDDVLRYQLDMEAVGQDMDVHLEAELHRAS